MTQRSTILSLLITHEKVTCALLSQNGVYHHASQRIGELKKDRYEIEFVKGSDWHDSYYRLISEPPLPVTWEGEQAVIGW